MAESSQDLDFSDLAPKQRKVIGPDKVKYLLVSASVDATLKYRSAAAKAGKWDLVKGPDGKDELKVVGFNDVAEQELVLVSNTLAESEAGAGERLLLDRSGNPVLVPPSRLKNWHGETISKLYKASLDLSPWLKQGDDTEVNPKDSSGSTEGSSKSPTT